MNENEQEAVEFVESCLPPFFDLQLIPKEDPVMGGVVVQMFCRTEDNERLGGEIRIHVEKQDGVEQLVEMKEREIFDFCEKMFEYYSDSVLE